MLPMPQPHWQAADFDAAIALAGEAAVPTAFYDRFDSWDDPSRAWRGDPTFVHDLHRYAAAVTVVAGPQLPLAGGPRHPLALPYPPMVARRASPPAPAPARFDVQFAGALLDPGWAAPPLDTRDRHHRGHLVAQLRAAVSPDRLAIRAGRYWMEDESAQQALRARSLDEMDQSTIVFAPAGFGYLTIRHSDAWARGRVVLSEPVQQRVLVPEPERWEAGEVAVCYDPAADDLPQVVAEALGDPRRLASVARAGWEYGRRWTDPRVQARMLADALTQHHD